MGRGGGWVVGGGSVAEQLPKVRPTRPRPLARQQHPSTQSRADAQQHQHQHQQRSSSSSPSQHPAPSTQHQHRSHPQPGVSSYSLPVLPSPSAVRLSLRLVSSRLVSSRLVPFLLFFSYCAVALTTLVSPFIVDIAPALLLSFWPPILPLQDPVPRRPSSSSLATPTDRPRPRCSPRIRARSILRILAHRLAA